MLPSRPPPAKETILRLTTTIARRASARGLKSALAASLAVLTLAAAPLPASAQGVAGPYMAAEFAARRGDILEAARYFSEALARDPENASILERATLHQVAAGRMGTAVTLARKLEEQSPGHHLSLLVLGADALRRGEPATVQEILDDTELEEAPFVTRLIKAWSAYGEGDVERARATLTEIEDQGIGGPAGRILAAYHLGLMATAEGKDEEAVAAFERATELSGTAALRLVRFHAGALARLGRTDEARTLVRDRLSQLLGDERLERLAAALADGEVPAPVISTASQGAAEALYGLSGFLTRGPGGVIAIAYARLATWMDPSLIEAQLLIADMLIDMEQFELASEAYAEVPPDAPEALEAMLGRARAMEEAKKVDAAVDLLREAVVRFPASVEAHTALGDMLRRASRFSEAAEAYDGGIARIEERGQEEQRFWPLYYQRGIAYERSDQWDKAEADFRRALALEPDQPLVLNYLGYSFVEMGRNIDEAEKMIEKAVEQRPEDGYIVDSLGWVQFRLGRFKEAAGNLERAVELIPVDPILNDHYGDALWMIGRRTEARFQWKRALSFEPEPEDAARIRQKLDVGLDVVLAEEAAQGKPTVITRDAELQVGKDG